jgi:hypothetical protein
MQTRDNDGYIYCFSNPAMPGIYKIGMTTRTPEARLKDANTSNTWKPPMPYRIEMFAKVSDPMKKEQSLHKLLEHYGKRIHPRREFFHITLREVRMFFALLDGDTQVSSCPYIYEHKEDENENNEDIEDILINTDNITPYNTNRNPFEQFTYREDT